MNKGSISFLVEAAISAESIPEGAGVVEIEPIEAESNEKKSPIPWFMSPQFPTGRVKNRYSIAKINYPFYVPLHLVERIIKEKEGKANQELAAATKEILLLKNHISALQKNSFRREFRNPNACLGKIFNQVV